MKLFQEKIQSILLVLFILYQAITPAFADVYLTDNTAYIIPKTDEIKVNNECERIIEGNIEFFLPEVEKKDFRTISEANLNKAINRDLSLNILNYKLENKNYNQLYKDSTLDILSNNLSKPKYFINFNKDTNLYKDINPLLSSTIANLSNNKIELNLDNSYTLVDLSIEGRNINYSNNKGKITVSLDNLESGKYNLKYRIKENKCIKDTSKIMDGKMIILPVDNNQFIIHKFKKDLISGNINWEKSCAELNVDNGPSNECRRPELIEGKTKEDINKGRIITEEIEVSLPLVGTPIVE